MNMFPLLQNFLDDCRCAGYSFISFNTLESDIDYIDKYMCYHYSVYAKAIPTMSNPPIWEICERHKVGFGCGNGHSHQLIGTVSEDVGCNSYIYNEEQKAWQLYRERIYTQEDIKALKLLFDSVWKAYFNAFMKDEEIYTILKSISKEGLTAYDAFHCNIEDIPIYLVSNHHFIAKIAKWRMT